MHSSPSAGACQGPGTSIGQEGWAATQPGPLPAHAHTLILMLSSPERNMNWIEESLNYIQNAALEQNPHSSVIIIIIKPHPKIIACRKSVCMDFSSLQSGNVLLESVCCISLVLSHLWDNSQCSWLVWACGMASSPPGVWVLIMPLYLGMIKTEMRSSITAPGDAVAASKETQMMQSWEHCWQQPHACPL